MSSFFELVLFGSSGREQGLVVDESEFDKLLCSEMLDSGGETLLPVVCDTPSSEDDNDVGGGGLSRGGVAGCPAAGRLVLRLNPVLLHTLLVPPLEDGLTAAVYTPPLTAGWCGLLEWRLAAVPLVVLVPTLRLAILTRNSSSLTVSLCSPAISVSRMLKVWSPTTLIGSG